MSLLSRFKTTLSALRLGDAPAVGVSGGLDSMVLMHLCARAGLRPLVVSIDHGLRKASASEVTLVAQSAASLGLPFQAHRLSLVPGAGIAARARDARLEIWAALPASAVLLAHHQDDQAETVLDRLCRGAGARGLSGMAQRSGKVLRPLLRESRESLLNWARRERIWWAEDPSNTQGTRGWMRHRVLPLLEERRPGSSACIARSAAHLAQDEDLLAAMAAPLLQGPGLSIAVVQSKHPALQRRALAQLLERERGERGALSARQLDLSVELLQRPGVVEVGQGWRFVACDSWLRCLPPKPAPAHIQDGPWGPWHVVASRAVGVRSAERGERLNGRRITDLMRGVGLPPALRPYLPVIHLGPQRWLPGVSFEGEAPLGVHVALKGTGSSALLGGGPFQRLL